jgi:uncharacterized membrane protein
MDQREIDEAEWKNPANWTGGMFSFYFSKRDSRTWVPKSVPALGWTVNLGKPAGAAWLVGIMFAIPAVILGLLVAAAIVNGRR